MGYFASRQGGSRMEEGQAVGVTCGSPAHTKGSWTQIIASTAFDAAGMIVQGYCWNTGAVFLLDIGIGAAASEKVLVPNLWVVAQNSIAGRFYVYVPVKVPAGSRISARAQCSTASATIFPSITFVGGALDAPISFGGIDAFSANTGGSTQQQYQTNGVAANTKCAWQEITASLSHDVKSLIIVESPYVGTSSATFKYDLAVGSAGNEKIILPNLVSYWSSEKVAPAMGYMGPIPCQIPAGSRVSWRMECTLSNSAVYARIGFYGLY